MSHRLDTIDQVIERAAELTDPDVLTWASAAAGQEITKQRNALALSSLALIPRVGRDVSVVSAVSSFCGVPVDIPVLLAPIGALALYDAQDATASAIAASEIGVSTVCSILTTASWGDVAALGRGRTFFQVYALGDREWLAKLIDTIEPMGFAGLCITMDSAAIGRRDRSLITDFRWETPEEGTVNLETLGWSASYRSSFTWEDLSWVCRRTELPVIVKGVMHPSDAISALDCGARALYVSNHGGRMVDHALSTIEALEVIVEAVPDSVDIAVDGGFTRGAEICKALALGAKVVGLGRLQCWGLAAGGVHGLTRVLEILREEIEITMANLGCAATDDFEPGLVQWSFPIAVTPAPRQSASESSSSNRDAS